jgi:hypothetical protein
MGAMRKRRRTTQRRVDAGCSERHDTYNRGLCSDTLEGERVEVTGKEG